jgi:hypothetical protein
MSETFHVNFSSFGPGALVNAHKNSFPYCDPTQPPGGNNFIKLAFVLCQKAFMQISAVLVQLSLRRGIIKYVSYINTCKNSFHYYDPTLPPGIMILTNLNLYYVRTLSCKFQLFYLSSS